MQRSIHSTVIGVGVAVLVWLTTNANAMVESPVLLISRTLEVQQGDLLSLDEQQLVLRIEGDQRREKPLRRFIALAVHDAYPLAPPTGMIVLNDGQQFPGTAAAQQPDDDVLVWMHPWLGSIRIPVDVISMVQYDHGNRTIDPADADVVLLNNGDRIEGFVVQLGDPVVIEVGTGEQARLLELRQENVAAVRLITPQRASNHKRVWLSDSTVIDVHSIDIDESGRMRLTTIWQDEDEPPARLRLVELAAVLLASHRLMPLADVPVQRVEGPPTRYTVPQPQVRDREAALGLSSIAYRGPLTAYYTLPENAQRFAAEVSIPTASRAWADVYLVVRDHQQELQRVHLNDASPTASINIELTSRDLIFEVIANTTGAVQSHVLLQRPMLLLGE
jgi:hypothetical protein